MLAEVAREDASVFAAGEVQGLVVEVDGAPEQVELEATMLEYGFLDAAPAPEQGADAGQELLDAEGFGQVIVGTEVHALDSILDRVACAQDEDRLLVLTTKLL